MALLHFVVVMVDVRPQLDLFDFDQLLSLSRFGLFFCSWNLYLP